MAGAVGAVLYKRMHPEIQAFLSTVNVPGLVVAGIFLLLLVCAGCSLCGCFTLTPSHCSGENYFCSNHGNNTSVVSVLWCDDIWLINRVCRSRVAWIKSQMVEQVCWGSFQLQAKGRITKDFMQWKDSYFCLLYQNRIEILQKRHVFLGVKLVLEQIFYFIIMLNLIAI